MKIKKSKTNRGFSLREFEDSYGYKCYVQKSSSAERDCIWLGIRDANPQVLASHAHEYGIKTDETTGWIPYPIPDEVLIHTQMHLTQKQAKALIRILQKFVDTGEL